MSPGTAGLPQACDPQKAADLLRALAHPMRLQILCRLLDGELSVAGLESELGLRQPNLSQQLGQLREAGLVATRREAKSIVYSLSDERVRGILDALRLVMNADALRPARPSLQPEPRPPAGPPARLAGRPDSTAPRSPTANVLSEPSGCGVFSIAGWPNASRRGAASHG